MFSWEKIIEIIIGGTIVWVAFPRTNFHGNEHEWIFVQFWGELTKCRFLSECLLSRMAEDTAGKKFKSYICKTSL